MMRRKINSQLEINFYLNCIRHEKIRITAYNRNEDNNLNAFSCIIFLQKTMC